MSEYNDPTRCPIKKKEWKDFENENALRQYLIMEQFFDGKFGYNFTEEHKEILEQLQTRQELKYWKKMIREDKMGVTHPNYEKLQEYKKLLGSSVARSNEKE